jgi:glycosyltransferase involved in cell wall biosynthesis
MSMTITAVITTFNRREFLREALASVRSQTRPPDEIVVLDDGSTDGTREEMAGVAGVKYRWQPNAGTSAARNAGWQWAGGEWIAFLDSDDLWTEDKLARQEVCALENPTLETVFGEGTNFATPGAESFFNAPGHRLGEALPAWLPSAALIRRATLDRTGGFDPQVKTAEVVDWVMRLRQAGVPMLMLPRVVLKRRLHAGNKQLQSDTGSKENLALVHRWMQQKSAHADKI